MRIKYNDLKVDIVKNYKEKLQKWFNECDKNSVDDLDNFDLKNIANDFGIDINKYKFEELPGKMKHEFMNWFCRHFLQKR